MIDLSTIPILTIRHPYAAGIFAHLLMPEYYVEPIKTIETRTRQTKIRGTIAVHAGLAFDRLERAAAEIAFPAGGFELFAPFGTIFGLVDIVDCVPANILRGQMPPTEAAILSHWDEKHWAYILANPRLLPYPVEAKGKLSFWRANIQIEELETIA